MSLGSKLKEKRDEIRDEAKKFTIGFGVAAIVLYVAACIFMRWEDNDRCLMMAFITMYTGIGCMLFAIVSFVMMLIIDRKKSDEAKQQLIQELEGTVQELQNTRIHDIESPFQNLTSEQEEKIAELFRTLPHHKDREDEINMKEVARYLTALEKLGYMSPAKSAQKALLRQWVMAVTGKQAPESSPFNQAYPSTNRKGVQDAEKVIKETLS